jgi:hypothetical protein
MAGFVKRSSAQRWNRTASIVEAAGAGSHFVRGIYRQPMRPGSVCEDLGDLQPGSYRGIAGATTAPGETGPVIVTGCEDEVTIDAVNHSGCTFYLGDRITVNVDPCCVAHFTGCSCCGSSHEPPGCCEISIAICIAGELKVLSVDGGSYTWDVSECCGCEGATVEVVLSCNGNNIEAEWTYTCGESTSTGTIELDDLCDFESDVEILGELDDLCDGNLNDRWGNFVEDCEPCEPEPPPPCDCCFAFAGYDVDECDKSEVPGFVDDIGLTNATVTRDPVCNGLATTVTLTYTNNTGSDQGNAGGGTEVMRIDLTSNVPTESVRPSCTSASDGGTITDNAPGKGFTVEWLIPDAWPDGTSLTRSFVMRNNGCTPGVSEIYTQAFAARGYICTIRWEAVACP